MTDGTDETAATGADYDTLYYGFGEGPPTVPSVAVYAATTADLLGAPWQFEVIGSSHRVYAPDLGFHEVASCRPPASDRTDALDLAAAARDRDADGKSRSESTTVARSYDYERGDLAWRTDLFATDLAAYPWGRSFDLEYAFDDRARTAIGLRDSTPAVADDRARTDGHGSRVGYETYHTYPEYGLTVVTETTVERR